MTEKKLNTPSALDYPVELIARVLKGRLRADAGQHERRVLRVTADSRDIRPGDLFFALSGERFNAHQFVADALARGAVAAVVNPAELPEAARAAGGALVEVDDPLRALGQLAAWHRNRFSVRVVAVTGSVGKTTTKDLLASILSQQWNTLKNPGNLNAEIGLPLTLLNLRPDHEAVVVELAMRGPGQIRYLAEIARPDVAVITCIGLSHLELLGSQDAIAEAKAEVLDYLPRGGAAVLNGDDRYFDFLRSRVQPDTRVVAFGSSPSSLPGVESITGGYLGTGPRLGDKNSTDLGARFTLRTGKAQNVRWAWVPLIGRHNMQNALAAAAAAHVLGVSWPRLNRGLISADVSAMRMSVYRLRDGSTILDDAYNASSPEAMISALEVLAELPGLRKFAILGSMLELGPMTEEAHRQVGEEVARHDVMHLITVGEAGAGIAAAACASGLPEDRVTVCRDNAEVLARARELRRPGDVVLVKGSRGMAMEHVVEGLRAHGAG